MCLRLNVEYLSEEDEKFAGPLWDEEDKKEDDRLFCTVDDVDVKLSFDVWPILLFAGYRTEEEEEEKVENEEILPKTGRDDEGEENTDEEGGEDVTNLDMVDDKVESDELKIEKSEVVLVGAKEDEVTDDKRSVEDVAEDLDENCCCWLTSEKSG